MPAQLSKKLALLLASRSDVINTHGENSADVCRHDVQICLEIKSSKLFNNSIAMAEENGWPFVVDFTELSHRVQGLRDVIRRVLIYSEELERTPVWQKFRMDFRDIAKFSRCGETQSQNLPNARPG